MHLPVRSVLLLLLTSLLSPTAAADPVNTAASSLPDACPISATDAQQQTQISACLQQAEAGSPSAAYVLGEIYYQGQQLTRDVERAYYWFSRAARAGEVNAQYRLGQMLFRGEGIESDAPLALVMLQIAFINGHEQAIDESDRVEQALTELQREQALTLLSQLFLGYQEQLLSPADQDPGKSTAVQPSAPGHSAPAIELNSDHRF